MLSRSSLYFQVLLLLDTMWPNGAPFILHHNCHAYYQCCIHLKSLRALHEREDLHFLRQMDFAQLLAGHEVPLLLAEARAEALAIMDLPHDDEAPGLHAAIVVAAPPMPAHIADMPAGGGGIPQPHKASTIKCDGVKVHFDGLSHASGIQRGYIHCRQRALHGDACFKYRQIVAFASRKHCAAWLLAWEQGGSGPAIIDKPLHAAFSQNHETFMTPTEKIQVATAKIQVESVQICGDCV